MFQFTAYDLRRNQTVSEHRLWRYLRARQMVGLKFRRQHPIGPYIVDFICLKKRLIIEVDGPIHDLKKAYDQRRDAWLKSQGFSVVRIQNIELEEKIQETLIKLRDFLLKEVV